MKWIPYLLLLFFSPMTWAQEVIPEVVVEGDDHQHGSPINPFSIFKSERVSQDKILAPNRQTLADIVQDQVGVDSQIYCANCGAKRLTINGLKGEHTSLLIDGIPLHSAVSSFYGVDSVPANGIQSIEVMRGAGASLTNPEAIGGTLNILTVDPLSAESRYQTSVGVDDQFFGKSQNHQMLYTHTSESKKWGLTVGGGFARTEAWDEDQNDVSEMPERQNTSTLLKTRFLLGSQNDFTFRHSYSDLDILGGFFRPTRPSRVRPVSAQESDFVDGNVEKDFIGDPEQITDWINLNRHEVALTGTHYLSDQMTLEWKSGFARQEQKAIYQHGFDYAHIDNMFVNDIALKSTFDDSQFFTVGVFSKVQRLRSSSAVLFEPTALNLPADSFDYTSTAAYAQYTHYWGETLELDLALRLDQVDVNWLELTNNVQETVLAPRLQILHNFNSHLSQRLSYGLGYRAPLTFFESQHGNQEDGYQIDITELEKAHSVVYSLSYNTPTYYITGSGHYTHLQNMAFGFETNNQPILYRNTDESYDIWVADLLLGYKPADWWLLETSFEVFQYEDGYTRKLPTAAIERRVQLKSEINRGPWTHLLRGTLVGSRDLSRYGFYDNHYVNRDQSTPAGEPLLNPNLEKKDQKAPTWFTLDTSISYEFDQALVLTFSVNNIFDYTQARAGDTPATWHWHFDHAHFDGLHTWGPNRGREFLLGLSGQF
jgi:outer membrane receptor for ferrienterochelin and colicins